MQQIPGQCLVHFAVIFTDILDSHREKGVKIHDAMFVSPEKLSYIVENNRFD